MLRLFLEPTSRGGRPKLYRMAMRSYSSEVTEKAVVPMLLRLRSDLKTAMKTKDTVRRDTIKEVLANIINAEKKNQPIDTDEKIRKLLLKSASAQKDVAQQLEQQNRNDLRDKELSQASILEAYAHEIKIVEGDDLKHAIDQIVNALKSNGDHVNTSNLMKNLRQSNGPLGGKAFDSAQAIALVKDMNLGK
ncbi:MAG: hypothetical protein GOMPHAMPRED_005958 [Gomphillus americanus]|uniref:Altered inheritance of mitochondria protein 41 n=1 Tax=Gomphillus americanus TaxID=1940652 RepID=A0A8H3G1U8_9LECA|nr:MAG: hypothetical protein GOMPHAMPRED_005958 [Gomphillus americanus]